MASTLQQCYAHATLAKQLQSLDEQLDAVAAPLHAAIAAATSEGAAVIADVVMQVVTDHDQLFTGSSVQNLDGAYADSKLKKIDRTKDDAVRNLVDNGFVSVKNTIYVCNSSTQAAAASNTIDVQDPDSLEYLKQVLRDPSYTDPKINTPVAQANTTTPNARSVTGAYLSPGAVADMREIFKGCGGDLLTMRKFLDVLDAGTGVGVIWSFMHYATAYSANGTALTFDAVRDQVQFPLYDEDINITGEKAIAAIEFHVGTQMSRTLALAQARVMCQNLGIPGEPVLMCRFVRMDTVPNVRSQSPVISTIGFDASLLGPTAYRLGISVCGYARIIDVTGDRGSRTLHSEYTNASVASAISRVFGDLLSVNGAGNEITFAVNQKGPGARIAFFYVDDYDAADACGVNGLVHDQAKRSGQNAAISLRDLDGARWTGGEPVPDTVTAAMQDAVARYEIYPDAVTAMMTGQQYWTLHAPAVHVIVDALVANTANVSDPEKTLALIDADVRSYATAAGFVDIVGLRYVDVKLLMDEFGSELAHVLSYYPGVYSIDIYRDKSSVLASFSQLVQKHIDSDGLVTASNSYEIVTAMRKNRAKLSYFYTLYRYTQVEAQNITSAEYAQNVNLLAAYTPSLYWDDSVTLTKPAPDTALPAKPNSSTSSLWSDALELGGTTLASNDDQAGSAFASVVSAMCRQTPDLCHAVDRFFTEAADAFSTQEERLAALIDWLTSPATGAWAAGISLIAMLNRLIDRAIALVTAAKGTVTMIVQNVTGKKSLSQALDAMANMNLNIYDNFGFQTKFLSCYVSGSGGALLSILLKKTLETLNDYISTINEIVTALIKALQKALDLLVCLADKASQNFEGVVTYERKGAGMYKAAGLVPVPVAFTLQCTMSFGADGLDPGMARELSTLKQKLTTLLSLFQLQTITYKKVDDTVKTFKGLEITKATAAGEMVNQLREQIKEKLLSLLSC